MIEMKTVLYTCVVIPIELHPSGMYASAGPDFGAVTDWYQCLGYRELGDFKTWTIATFTKT